MMVGTKLVVLVCWHCNLVSLVSDQPVRGTAAFVITGIFIRQAFLSKSVPTTLVIGDAPQHRATPGMGEALLDTGEQCLFPTVAVLPDTGEQCLFPTVAVLPDTGEQCLFPTVAALPDTGEQCLFPTVAVLPDTGEQRLFPTVAVLTDAGQQRLFPTVAVPFSLSQSNFQNCRVHPTTYRRYISDTSRTHLAY
jgi:hypothetical protein